MKTIIILYVLAAALPLWSAPKVNTQRPIIVFNYPDGKHRMILNLLPVNANAQALNSVENSTNQTSPLMTIFPNPIENNADISFDLSVSADVELWASDNFNQVSLFKGFLTKGKQSLNYDFAPFKTGLVIVYLKINGKFYVSKAIKS